MENDYAYDDDDEQTQQATQSTQQPSQANPVDTNIWGILQPCNANNTRMDFPKTSPTVRIGRHALNTFVLPGCRVSNQHCEIVWNGVSDNDTATVTVLDMSTNGTFINGSKLGKGHQGLLHDGNEISFGTVIPQGPQSHEDYRYIFRMVAGGDKLEGVHVDYEMSHELGKGAFATVVKAMSRKTGEWVAVKMIQKRPQGSTSVTTTQTQLNREINIMTSLSHPNICAMKDVYYHQDGSINLVLELVEGGDLLDYITSRDGLSEDLTRHITWQLCDALAYVHSLGVTHRDLKPENVLLTQDDPPIVKVADFGLAKVVDSLTMLRTMCGTPSYLAPEVVKQENHQGYDNLVDSWSVGVIVYSMLTNTTPFIEDENQPDIRMRIAERRIHWEPLEAHSPEARHFIKALLETDPAKRMTMQDSRKHRWFDSYTPVYDLANKNSAPMDQELASTPANNETNGEAPVLLDVSMKSNGDADGEAIVSSQMDNLQLDAPTPPKPKNDIPRQSSRLERRSDVLLRAEEEGRELLQPSQEMVSREEKQRELQESEPARIDALEGSSKKRPFSDLEAVAEVDEAYGEAEPMDLASPRKRGRSEEMMKEAPPSAKSGKGKVPPPRKKVQPHVPNEMVRPPRRSARVAKPKQE
ncbi:CAMK/RAD53 protein kinase [Desarmillaria tabescens]|uniref:CAMK/RAD53 protein kinase n=1 Tax=Armillaria tabescens TaxID=1929756 RepID=A0AA39NBF8_ARMTA|nr:CAMK/RAD53 protein kinase [Desarmillaria tabescens]KAK0462542.1 CAMK/RAD53 protein kinase [Desarmillaria tabescens]